MNHRVARLLAALAVSASGVSLVATPAEAVIRGTCSEGDTFVIQQTSQYVSYDTTMPSYFQESFDECTLRQSSTYNRAVVWLQWSLRECHGQPIAVDGRFGSATRQALVNVQRRLGINPDGVYGPQTWRNLNWPVFASYPNGQRVRQSNCWGPVG